MWVGRVVEGESGGERGEGGVGGGEQTETASASCIFLFRTGRSNDGDPWWVVAVGIRGPTSPPT